jgi:transmembrane protein TMEM174 (potassium channel)
MSRVFNTSTMKSPPLLLWLTRSANGGMVSAAASLGPGTAALARSTDRPDAGTLAATGVVSAAAPASVAPLRKLRRPVLGEVLRFDMVPSPEFATGCRDGFTLISLASVTARHDEAKSTPELGSEANPADGKSLRDRVANFCETAAGHSGIQTKPFATSRSPNRSLAPALTGSGSVECTVTVNHAALQSVTLAFQHRSPFGAVGIAQVSAAENRAISAAMFAKARLDTLSDRIFGVAMTLLILDVRLPDDFNPADAGELINGLANLWPKFFPYLLSFGVLGLRWLANVEVRTRAEFVNREYVNW